MSKIKKKLEYDKEYRERKRAVKRVDKDIMKQKRK